MGISDSYQNVGVKASAAFSVAIANSNAKRPGETGSENPAPVKGVFVPDIYNPKINPDKATDVDEQKFERIMRQTAQLGAETVTSRINELAGAIPFSDSQNNGNIKADLKISLVDKNGYMDNGNKDMDVTINGDINIKKDVFFNSLKTLEGKAIKHSLAVNVDIGKVNFDSKDKSYKIELKLDGLRFIKDNINLVVKADNDKNLVMTVEDKWIPGFLVSDKLVLTQAKNAIAKELQKQNFGLDSVIKDGKFYFLPKINDHEIKLNAKESLRIDDTNLNHNNIKFDIDSQGNIGVNLKDLKVTASNLGKDDHGNNIPEQSAGDPDTAEVDVSADINLNGSKVIKVNSGSFSAGLDAKESQGIKIEGSTLGNHFNDSKVKIDGLNGKITIDNKNKVSADIGGNVSVSLIRPNKTVGIDGHFATSFNSSGDFKIASKDMSVSHPDGINKLTNFSVSSDKDGLKLDIKEPAPAPKTITEKITKNDLKIFIGPQEYLKNLNKQIDKAKESINVESYLYSGDVGKNLTNKLLIKAGGLTETINGKVKFDNQDGVKVKVMFDSSTGDKTPETHESVLLVNTEFKKFIEDVKAGNGKFASLTSAQKDKVVSNVTANMQWKMDQGGVTEIDHRKGVVIDGHTAFTGGGINFTDSVMRKHDMMINVWGPAVNTVQADFIKNWEEVAGKIPDNEKAKLLKDDKTLTSIMKSHQQETGSKPASDTQVLVTDDSQFEVYDKLVEKIKTAKNINIEHAYFTDKRLVNEIAGAIKNGTNVNVIVPEYSDEGDKLHYGNLGTLQVLKKASEEAGAGKFNAYFYKWNESEKTGQFSHTKAVSFDGESAIVGSTNLTARSLHGTINDFLFNKEMSLYVDDKNFTKDLNKKLFATDMSPEFGKKLDDQFFKDLEKEQAKIDKYTAIQPLF